MKADSKLKATLAAIDRAGAAAQGRLAEQLEQLKIKQEAASKAAAVIERTAAAFDALIKKIDDAKEVEEARLRALADKEERKKEEDMRKEDEELAELEAEVEARRAARAARVEAEEAAKAARVEAEKARIAEDAVKEGPTGVFGTIISGLFSPSGFFSPSKAPNPSTPVKTPEQAATSSPMRRSTLSPMTPGGATNVSFGRGGK